MTHWTVTRCVLCHAPLPPIRWWERWWLLAPPPRLCPPADAAACHARFQRRWITD